MKPEQPKFEIGRFGMHEFQVYETAPTVDKAIKAYRAQILHVSNPEEITIFEVGANQPRKDLVIPVWEEEEKKGNV